MAVLEKLDGQIARKQEKLNALKARKQAIENRQKVKVKEQERKAETRRKILVGAEVLKRARNHPDQYARVLAMMDETLTREDDRKLFGLDLDNRLISKVIFCSTPRYITPQSTHTADQIDALNYDSAPVRWQIA